MSAQARHTPGPWSVEWMSHTVTGIGTNGRIVTSRGPVCFFPEEEAVGPRYERDLNALLVSAAPDLLEMLVDLVSPESGCLLTKHALDNARAAIAKATGKE